eukprot:9468812-Pyramimonas_sp.AAC.1
MTAAHGTAQHSTQVDTSRRYDAARHLLRWHGTARQCIIRDNGVRTTLASAGSKNEEEEEEREEEEEEEATRWLNISQSLSYGIASFLKWPSEF